jgi:uncharacterized SAM-binding protein YcdF (DUF218 family)
VIFFIIPLTLFWLILLAGLLFYLLKLKRIGLACGFLSFVWLAIISLPFLPDLLVRSLELRYSSMHEISHIQPDINIHILVLGAGYYENKNLTPNYLLSANSLNRLIEGIWLHKLLKDSQLVLHGFLIDKNSGQGNPFVNTAMMLGVEDNQILLLGGPGNTRMEAIEYTKKFGTNNTLMLVTDAIHMPRAMYLFQKAGQKPIPAPTNYLMKSNVKSDLREWFPSASNIYNMEYAMHEIIGLWWAKLTWRTK